MLNINDSKLKISNKKPPSKSICIMNFQSKAIEYIKLYKKLNKCDVIVELQRELQDKESRPSITYILTNTVKNKILNYKDTVNCTKL